MQPSWIFRKARVLRHGLRRHIVVAAHRADVSHRRDDLPRVSIVREPALQHRGNVPLLMIPEDDVDGKIILQLLPCCLGIAARRHDHRLRIHGPGAVQHLAGFPVRDIRHGAGIDHIDVRRLLKGTDRVSGPDQSLAHRLCLVGVHLAAEGMKCNASHTFSRFHSIDFVPRSFYDINMIQHSGNTGKSALNEGCGAARVRVVNNPYCTDKVNNFSKEASFYEERPDFSEFH